MTISPDPMQFGNSPFVRTIYIVLIEYIFLALVSAAIYLHISETVRCLWCVLNINFFGGVGRGDIVKIIILNMGKTIADFFLLNNSNKQGYMLNINF